MPTLTRRQDGCYIVRNCQDNEFSTWQVTADGFLFLQRRGVREGAAFSVELFIRLKTNNWVYTGDHPPPQATSSTHLEANDLPPELGAAIRDFHSALRAGDAFNAQALMLTLDASEGTDAPMENQPTGLVEIESWKRRDCNVWRLPAESGDAFGGAEDVATVTISLRLRGCGQDNSPMDIKEYWLRTVDGWRVLWNGVPARATR
jgi:hypothetical protein